LQQALEDSTVNFTSLVIDFLKGKGIPCVELFDDAKVHFNSVVDPDQVGTDGFQAKMHCWALSGSSEWELDALRIVVSQTWTLLHFIVAEYCQDSTS